MGSQRAAQRDQQHREQMRGDKGVRVLKGKRRKRGDREVLVLHGALYAPSVGGGLLHCRRVARLCSPMAGCLPSSLQALHENEWLLGTGGCWGYGAAWGHGAVGVGVRSPVVPMLQHLHAGSQRWDHPTQPRGRFCPAQVRQHLPAHHHLPQPCPTASSVLGMFAPKDAPCSLISPSPGFLGRQPSEPNQPHIPVSMAP